MPKYISISNTFFKYKTLTQAMSAAKKMGITNEIFNKLRIKQAISNWTKCREEYKRNKNKPYIYKEEYIVKEEDILCIKDIDDIDNIIEEEQERLQYEHCDNIAHEYEHKDKDLCECKTLNENNINDNEFECKVQEEDIFCFLVNDNI